MPLKGRRVAGNFKHWQRQNDSNETYTSNPTWDKNAQNNFKTTFNTMPRKQVVDTDASEWIRHESRLISHAVVANIFHKLMMGRH